jgi:hypothetical protein
LWIFSVLDVLTERYGSLGLLESYNFEIYGAFKQLWFDGNILVSGYKPWVSSKIDQLTHVNKICRSLASIDMFPPHIKPYAFKVANRKSMRDSTLKTFLKAEDFLMKIGDKTLRFDYKGRTSTIQSMVEDFFNRSKKRFVPRYKANEMVQIDEHFKNGSVTPDHLLSLTTLADDGLLPVVNIAYAFNIPFRSANGKAKFRTLFVMDQNLTRNFKWVVRLFFTLSVQQRFASRGLPPPVHCTSAYSSQDYSPSGEDHPLIKEIGDMLESYIHKTGERTMSEASEVENPTEMDKKYCFLVGDREMRRKYRQPSDGYETEEDEIVRNENFNYTRRKLTNASFIQPLKKTIKKINPLSPKKDKATAEKHPALTMIENIDEIKKRRKNSSPYDIKKSSYYIWSRKRSVHKHQEASPSKKLNLDSTGQKGTCEEEAREVEPMYISSDEEEDEVTFLCEVQNLGEAGSSNSTCRQKVNAIDSSNDPEGDADPTAPEEQDKGGTSL